MFKQKKSIITKHAIPKILGLLVLLLGFCFATPSKTDEFVPQAFPIWESGAPEKRTNIVFLAEGYQANQTGQFTAMVLRTMEEMKNFPPFSTHMNHFNLYAIWTPSKDRGVSKGSVQRDTYYGLEAGFCASLSDSTKPDPKKLLNELVPEWTVAIMFYRDEDNFGHHTCAQRITKTPDRWDGTTSDDDGQEQVNVVIHEYGHILANLSDEHELLSNCKETSGEVISHHPPPAILAKRSKEMDFLKANQNQVRNVDSRDLTSREESFWSAWISHDIPVPTPKSPEFNDVVGYFKANCKQ